jgi:DNA-binding beta-propeller fold protein YncE
LFTSLAAEIQYNASMPTFHRFLVSFSVITLCIAPVAFFAQDPTAPSSLKQMPNSKLLGHVPGQPQRTNNFPTAIAVSPDKRFAVLLHSGYGSYSSGEKQSLSVLNLETNELTDFPDDRLGQSSKQTYFLGLAFSLDGHHLFASMASLTDPLAKQKGSTGNGIAVYAFEKGNVTPERFLALAPRTKLPPGKLRREELKDVTYPAGLSVGQSGGEQRILVASENSDEAILLNASDGRIIHRYDLCRFRQIPGSLPYTTVITNDGKRGFVSLWNASTVAELDLLSGRVLRMIALRKPGAAQAGGSHPTALVLNSDSSLLFVALTNRDEIVALDTHSGKILYSLSTKLPGQKYGGSDPEYLALSADEKALFSANAISDSVAEFDVSHPSPGSLIEAQGFIPTQWYPTVVATTPNDLLIGTAKGRGSAPNPKVLKKDENGLPEFPYVAAITQGSLARIHLSELPTKLADWTAQVVASNLAQGNADKISFADGENKIRHVIYIIKENRTYDQVFGDLTAGNGDASLTMYGEDITPNQHQLARQFGVLDNFYDSGDVSGDGHIWSTSASISDYVQKTWPIAYRGGEYTYDSEGQFLGAIAAEQGLPDAAEPTGGYLWKNFAKHGISYRHYGEFIVTRWCNEPQGTNVPTAGPPNVAGVACPRTVTKKGEPLEKNVGDPRGGPSPYGWDIPLPAQNIAAEIELRGHFDPLYPDFEVAYPDQLRVDEFLNEFNSYLAARKSGKDTMPKFTLLRLGNDHTEGGRKGKPTPAASVADNDLAVGRVVDAISHSAYWDDTAILILEDDAQDGPDHVDSHRSIALVISKYAPIPDAQTGKPEPFVDHHFYTTINMVHTIESLLGAPPMNANDSRAAVMAPLFSGTGKQPPFSANYRNRDNGLLYQANTKEWKEGSSLDFSHADAADTVVLNKYLWEDRMGFAPMPPPKFTVFPPKTASARKPGREERDRD